ncbi:hypothetical protein ACA910_008850 [Epithemia clementina (nom. ined.)]
MQHLNIALLIICLLSSFTRHLLLTSTTATVQAFSSTTPTTTSNCHAATLRILQQSSSPRTFRLWAETDDGTDDDDLIARRIIVEGDVQGGYYRSCVLNEAGRFRRLVGTMSPPDYSSRQAEIYVEGKRKLVEGFIRWCRRGKVGLSQVTTVAEVIEEEPTGLYDDFYVETKR